MEYLTITLVGKGSLLVTIHILKMVFLLYQIVQWEMRSIYMLFIIQSKFSLHAFYLFFLLVCVNLFEGLRRLIVEYYKITIAYIKTRKMITSIFCIKNVFIDHKSCSSGFWSVPSIKSNELQLMLKYILKFLLTLWFA